MSVPPSSPDSSPHAPVRRSDGIDVGASATRRAQRLGVELHLSGAIRLVSQTLPDREMAARKLLANGVQHGIDFGLMFGTVDTGQPRLADRVRQACLMVPGSGRTAMFFLSEPAPGGDPGGNPVAYSERIACITAACGHAEAEMAATVRLFQALPEPGESWLIGAYLGAGFQQISELEYLRRPRQWLRKVKPRAMPDGLRFVSVSEIDSSERTRVLMTALERTYAQTLDCPELCGMRETADVLDSHLKTGQFDPRIWTLAMLNGEPQGCLLLSRVPEQRACELVYLGLAPVLRGMGVASGLLAHGLELPLGDIVDSITCAVDGRNTPAKALYDRFGFRPFGRRVALVKASGAKDPIRAAMG